MSSSGAAFVGHLDLSRHGEAVPIPRPLRLRPTNAAFVSQIRRPHQMEPWWPRTSQNALQTRLAALYLGRGQLMTQPDVFGGLDGFT